MSTFIGPRLDAVIDFLKQRFDERAKQLHHGFIQTQTGIYDMLAQSGAEAEVCLAGLMHGVYELAAPRKAAVDVEERALVVSLVGERAERLVHTACSLLQPETAINTLAEQHRAEVRLRGENGLRTLHGQDARDLVTIECARLLSKPALNMTPAFVREAQRTGMIGAHGFVPFRRRSLEGMLRQDGAAAQAVLEAQADVGVAESVPA